MNGQGLKELRRDITCVMCDEHYTAARLLPCCHYYCKKCLEQTLNEETTAYVIECSKCKENFTNISEIDRLPPVLFVEHLKHFYEKISKLDEKRSVACEMCSDHQALAFCGECREFICSDCVACHQKMRIKFAGHHIHSFAELKQSNVSLLLPMKQSPATRCEDHNEPCKLYCSDCHQLICRDCIIINHAEHQYEFIMKSATICRESLKEKLAPLLKLHSDVSEATKEVTVVKCALTSQGTYVVEHIRKKFAEMYKALKQREEELLKQSEEMVQRKMKTLNTQECELNRLAYRVNTLIDYVNQNLQVLNAEELLSVQYHLHQRLEEQKQKMDGIILSPVESADIAVKITCVEQVTELCNNEAHVYFFPQTKDTHVALVGKETTQYVIDRRDSSHESKFPLTASLMSLVERATINVSVFKAGKGLYEVQYVPLVRGRHELTINRNGKPISSTPFPVSVSLPPTQLGPDPVRIIHGLRHPYAVVFDSDQQVLVTESSGMKIRKLHMDGSSMKKLNHKVSSFNYLEAESPTGLALDRDGNIYVASASDHSVTKFNKDGEYMKKSGEMVEGEMEHPCGIAIFKHLLYVCDRNNCRVRVFDLDLNPVWNFGSPGQSHGHFQWPYDLAQNKDGQIFISDCDNHRIQVFTEYGEFVGKFGNRGNDMGHLKRPMGICMGADDLHLFVTEFDNHRVTVFKSDGTFVTSFCKYGSKPGQLCYPMGVAVDSDGFVYVCDQGNNRIQVF